MEALEFVNEFKRMCNQSSDNCSDCPLDKIGCAITMMDDKGRKNLVEEVKKWSEAHPKKTRQSEFLKMFPRAKTLSDGILTCMPCEVDCEVERDCRCNFGCDVCRENYWLQEVE